MTARRIAWAAFWCAITAPALYFISPGIVTQPAYYWSIAAALVIGTSARIRLRMTGRNLFR